MATNVTITVEDNGAQALFDRVLSFGDDQTKPMRLIALAAEQEVRQTYRDESSPWGDPWAAHSPVTLAARRRRGQSSVQKLIDTGGMYASIERQSDRNSATVSAGEWAGVHQFGNPSNLAWGRGSAPIPARPSFPIRAGEKVDLTQEWIDRVTAPLESHLKEIAK